MKQLRVTFKGNVTKADAVGFVGQECEDVVAQIDSLFDLQERDLKPERYEEEVVVENEDETAI